MQELTYEEMADVSGGRSMVKVAMKSFETGWAIGQGINWLMDNLHMGRGNFPPIPRAGRE
ncbi:hypothetical protein [Massilia sp. Leaf139]|uniref:hypothetical protein n=1 Tax=Massilia sp. Leaf139 TaxID=1736272 RepID=UPI0006FD010E|nr:hypothetical protein [Massilia sp. Leaf139]KQQ88963.1 hypothetical protein ASF77_09635 [Massilia sp. Leaf139]